MTDAAAVHYDPAYYEHLYALEAGNFWFRARNRLLLWALRTHLQPEHRRFLEIGCGTGFVLSAIEAAFPQLEVAGSEVLEEGLAFARTRVKRSTLLQLDARALPFCEELDVIGAFDVLEHIEEDEAVLAQIHRALRPNGLLLLAVPQHPWLWSRADGAAGHVRRYSASELSLRVERAGFRVQLRTGFVSLLLPLLWASRWRDRLSRKPFDHTAELSLPPLLNRGFESLMNLERRLIALGVRFPAGGSLLLVAEKQI